MSNPEPENKPEKHSNSEEKSTVTNGGNSVFLITKKLISFFFKWVMFPVFVIVLFLLLFLTFFPFNTLKNYVLEDIANIDTSKVAVGYLDFSLFSGLSIDGIEIKPPDGFQKSIFKIDKISVEYSIWHLFSNEFHINNILLDSPEFNFEIINETTNISAFLATLPKSSPSEANEQEPPADGTKEKSSFKIILHNFNLRNFAAYANTGKQILDLKYLNIRLKGFFSEIASHFDISVDIAGNKQDIANFHFKQQSPIAAEADFILAMQTEISADNVLTPDIKIHHNFDIKSTDIKTEWPVDPISISQKLDVNASMTEDKATISTLSFTFNKHEILNLTAELSGIFEQQKAILSLNKFDLPLDMFAPYVKAIDNRVDFGGNIAINGLRASADIDNILKNGLPQLTGELSLSDVWAKYNPLGAIIKGLNSSIHFYVDPDKKEDSKWILSAGGNIDMSSLSSQFGNLHGLKLKFDTKADGLAIKNSIADISLDIADLKYSNDNTGQIELDFKFKTKARANLVDGIFNIDNLDINIKNTLLLELALDSQVDLSKQIINNLNLYLNLKPLYFKKLLTLFPEKIKAMIPDIDIAGSLQNKLQIKSTDAFSFSINDPFTIPIEISNQANVNDLSITYAGQHLEVNHSNLILHLQGSPDNLKVSGNFKVVSLVKKDLALSLKNIELPLKLTVQPSKLLGEIGLQVAELNSAQEAATINNLTLSISPFISGNFLKQRISNFRSKIKVNCNDITYAKNDTILVEMPEVSIDMNHVANKQNTKLKIQASLSALKIPNQNITIDKFFFNLKSGIEGSGLPIAPGVKLEPDKILITNQISIDSISIPDVMHQKLTNTNISFNASINNLNEIELKSANLVVPSIGAEISTEGIISGLKDKLNHFIDFETTLPEYILDFNASIKNASSNQLLENLSISGMTGLSFQLRSLPDMKAKVEGRLLANRFSLKTSSSKTVENNDNTTTTTKTLVEMNDFDANVPFIQYVDLKNHTLVKSEVNVFKAQSRNVLYETMRNYMQQQSNFNISNVLWKQNTNGVEKELKIDKISLDVMYSDNTFAINRMYVGLLGGGITGALQVNLASVYPDPLDVQIHFENQITGINLAYLTAKDKKTVSPETEFSSLVKLNFGLADRFLEGNVDITRLSLAQLDELLIFLDPEGEDLKVQSNRDLINSWYFKLINPKVKLVSMWINYGNLNMDINMDAWFFIGTILKKTLENNKIRRYDIVPILNTFLPKPSTQTAKKSGSKETTSHQ